jgi:hypothetical protein
MIKLNEQERNGFFIFICGLSIIMVVLMSQYLSFLSFSFNNHIEKNLRISMTEEQVKSINDVALPTFIIFLIGLTLALVGIRMISKVLLNMYLIETNVMVLLSIRNSISAKLKKFLSNKIFLLSSICYFIIISLLSNTIIFRPFSSFSQIYHVVIPSWYIIGCCGFPGNYPVLTIYITNQFGLLLVPINIILSSILSLLVGINISLMLFKVQKKVIEHGRKELSFCSVNSKQNHTMLSIGAILGLFIECPVCAGSVLFYFFGANLTAAGITASIASETQPFFIIASFVLLLVPPIMIRANKF